MPSKRKYLRIAASRACAAALEKRQKAPESTSNGLENPTPCSPSPIVVDSDSDSETAWQGGINHFGSTDEGESDSEDDCEAGYETVSEFSEEDVARLALGKSLYDQIQASKTTKHWTTAEANRTLGYNGQSSQTRQRRDKEAQLTQYIHSNDPKIMLMRNYFAPRLSSQPTPATETSDHEIVKPIIDDETFTPAELVNFSSDEEDGEYEADNEEEERSNITELVSTFDNAPIRSLLPVAPPLKRRCLEVPVRTQRERSHKEKVKQLNKALADLEKFNKSKKTTFAGGTKGLQAVCTLAMQSFLRMVVKNGRLSVDASKRAAESYGFAAQWGGQKLCAWTKDWIKMCSLPKSQKGCHGKVYSMLDDPAIYAELLAYIRSNKWVMNPSILKEFSAGKLIPTAAEK
ncbi:hypothetical protein C0993_007958 [Termitomyces sp. T159_Od127]|nr:hypothetical protein C0993_007958 [Termitomyces sp. T159_Od127]